MLLTIAKARGLLTGSSAQPLAPFEDCLGVAWVVVVGVEAGAARLRRQYPQLGEVGRVQSD